MWEWGEGVAAADDSREGGVPMEFDGLLVEFMRLGLGGAIGGVMLWLGLMVGVEVEDNGPIGIAGELLVAGDAEEGGADGVLLLLRDGLLALVTGTEVAATELVAPATVTDDRPEMAVAAVVLVSGKDGE